MWKRINYNILIEIEKVERQQKRNLQDYRDLTKYAVCSQWTREKINKKLKENIGYSLTSV